MMMDSPSPEWERVQQAQDKYQDMLLRFPHVIGVAVGYATVAGQTTPEPALIVMVDAKVEAQGLANNDLIPQELDGVRVDVQEFGAFSAQ
jgi:hypothetical protein